MQKAGLTDKQIKHAKANPDKRLEIPVGSPSGLYLVLHPSGKKSWAFRYRWHGRPSKLTFSKSYPEMTLAAARAEAEAALSDLKSGTDPIATKVGEDGQKPNSVREAAKAWLEYVKPDMRTWRDAERRFEKDVYPAWDRKLIHEVRAIDVKTLHAEVSKRGKIAANRLFETLRNFFNWCVDEGILGFSPLKDIDYGRLRNAESSRDRALSDEELAFVWDASGELEYPLAPFMQSLILTAQRRGEVAGMRWQDIDLQTKTWVLPKELTKNNKCHDVPLSGVMVDLLKKIPRFPGEFVFSSNSGGKPINGFSKAKKHLDEIVSAIRTKAGKTKPIPRWTMHDVRRTVATSMAKAGVPPHVLSKLLNHSQTARGVTEIYNRHQYMAERREALEAWASYVDGLSKQKQRRAS